MDLTNELNSKLRDLDVAIKSLRKTGSDYAEAYTKYRVALAQELIQLKNDGYAITLAGDIARGKPEIAKLKYKEISTEAIYKANLESINATKLAIKIIQEQIGREWANE
ncbi:MAG: hypothetical protein J6S67_05905 [Methanobrevibacter sp.]|nr:hypothetical protein [Methanobrevibacter sp.]